MMAGQFEKRVSTALKELRELSDWELGEEERRKVSSLTLESDDDPLPNKSGFCSTGIESLLEEAVVVAVLAPNEDDTLTGGFLLKRVSGRDDDPVPNKGSSVL